ncbi:pentapeptide repeat-containing protein [Paenibacillus sp. KS1]|uniref:pentapeptide repeat-containing protein n=1 Tax=Paenibacillus sp. KS1 TaxID=1849249 RepID=UPI0009F30BD4
MLCDADFRDCDMRGVDLSYTNGQGMASGVNRQPGLLGVANMEGADFTHARLYGADFTGARPGDAVFLQKDRECYRFSEEQAARCVITMCCWQMNGLIARLSQCRRSCRAKTSRSSLR